LGDDDLLLHRRRADEGVVTSGRFGQGIDTRRAQVATKAKPAYQGPPFTVECWVKVPPKDTVQILVANGLKESSTHWELYTDRLRGEFRVYLPGYTPAEIGSGV